MATMLYLICHPPSPNFDFISFSLLPALPTQLFLEHFCLRTFGFITSSVRQTSPRYLLGLAPSLPSNDTSSKRPPLTTLTQISSPFVSLHLVYVSPDYISSSYIFILLFVWVMFSAVSPVSRTVPGAWYVLHKYTLTE